MKINPKVIAIYRKIKKLIFDWVRPLSVKDIDSNEQFECVYCGTPVLNRVLACSKDCLDKFDETYFNEKVKKE